MEQKQRVIVYIDGFNFYYGLKSNAKWKKYYWLDVVKLFEMFMRPNQELVAVKYFSARPNDINQSLRQNAFFQANRENPKFKLILGKYLKKSITCFRCGNIIHTHEEKETDVRIATQIVADAYNGHEQGYPYETIWKPFQTMPLTRCVTSWKGEFWLTYTGKVESLSKTLVFSM